MQSLCRIRRMHIQEKDIDKLESFVKIHGAKGLAWMKSNDEGFSGPIAKFFDGDKQDELKQLMNINDNDLVLFVADRKKWCTHHSET